MGTRLEEQPSWTFGASTTHVVIDTDTNEAIGEVSTTCIDSESAEAKVARGDYTHYERSSNRSAYEEAGDEPATTSDSSSSSSYDYGSTWVPQRTSRTRELAGMVPGLLVLGVIIALLVYGVVALRNCAHQVAFPQQQQQAASTAPVSKPAPPAAPASLCGSPGAKPASIAPQQWATYSCQPRKARGCLRRSTYTTEEGRGCPSDELCCPTR